METDRYYYRQIIVVLWYEKKEQYEIYDRKFNERIGTATSLTNVIKIIDSLNKSS